MNKTTVLVSVFLVILDVFLIRVILIVGLGFDLDFGCFFSLGCCFSVYKPTSIIDCLERLLSEMTGGR